MYRLFNYICALRRVLFDFVAPKTDDRPSFGFKPCRYFGVTLHIPLNLRYPKFLMRFKVFLTFFPIVSMPKLTIAKYSYLFADKGNDVFEFLQANVNMANDIVRKTSPDAVFSNMQFEVKSFSDNFMILIRKTPQTIEYQAIKALVSLMALFQLRFLEKYSILVFSYVDYNGCRTIYFSSNS